MRLSDYQDFTPTTNLKPTIEHVLAGLSAEAGEVAGVFQKFYRGDYDIYELRRRLVGEIGGLLWYLSELANLEELDLETVLQINRDKLLKRQQENTLRGDGDDR